MLRITITLIVLALFQFYFFKRIKNVYRHLVNSDGIKNSRKYLTAFLLWVNLYPFLLILYFSYSALTGYRMAGPVYSQFFDFLVAYPFWVFILTVLQTAIILIIADLIFLISKLISKLRGEKFVKHYAKISALIFTVFIVFVPARIIHDMNFVNVTDLELILPDKKEGSGDIVIGFISDVQADWYTQENRLGGYIEKVNETDPDLVLIAGDIITSTPNYVELGAEYISRIKSEHGVYSCVGDHDNWVYRGNMRKSRKTVKNALENEGVHLLDNQNKVFQINGKNIGVTFITDTYSERIHTAELDSLSLKSDSLDLKILLSHQPTDKLIRFAEANDYDLMLAGHTHGGQITLLFPFLNLTPTLLETNLVQGQFMFCDLILYVNSGLGVSLAPVRYNSTPEVTKITIM